MPTPSGYSNTNLAAAVKGFYRCHSGPKSVNLRKGDYPGWTLKRDRGFPSGRDSKHEGALPFQFPLLYGSQGPKNDLQRLAATGQQRTELCRQPGRVGGGVGCGPSWEAAADLLHVRPGWRRQGGLLALPTRRLGANQQLLFQAAQSVPFVTEQQKTSPRMSCALRVPFTR